MNRVAICPPMPVVCPVAWPYKSLSLHKTVKRLILTINIRVEPVLFDGSIVTFTLSDATNLQISPKPLKYAFGSICHRLLRHDA